MALILTCCVRYEVFTETIMKITLFFDVTLCNRARNLLPESSLTNVWQQVCCKWVSFSKNTYRHILHECIVELTFLQTVHDITLKWVTATSPMCFTVIVILCYVSRTVDSSCSMGNTKENYESPRSG